MRGGSLNLAERPFVNERPAKRTTITLWFLGAALLILNGFLYQQHLSGQHEQRQTMAMLEKRIVEEEASIEMLEHALAELELRRQNRQVAFLNAQIAKRTFSWSRLFDELTEVLPSEVQLRRVLPKVVEEREREDRAWAPAGGDLVAIELGGVAKSGEAVLNFVDALFAHPSFEAPNLSNEWQQDDAHHEFSLSVRYRTSRSGTEAESP